MFFYFYTFAKINLDFHKKHLFLCRWKKFLDAFCMSLIIDRLIIHYIKSDDSCATSFLELSVIDARI